MAEVQCYKHIMRAGVRGSEGIFTRGGSRASALGLAVRRYEDAFSTALSASNVDVVSWLCTQVEASIMSQVLFLRRAISTQERASKATHNWKDSTTYQPLIRKYLKEGG